MPELPEVEVSRLGITPLLQGQTIAQVKVYQPQLRWPVPATVHNVEHQKIIHIHRRAKYLLLETAKGSLILHLGMSGKLRVIAANTPRIKHDHVDIVLANGQCLRLNDPRRFGAFLFQAVGETHELLQRLGPEPLDDAFSADYLWQQAQQRKTTIKQFIMSNQVVVGVGNIYANEALFKANVHPQQVAGQLTLADCERLVSMIKQTLIEAIQQGGTTLKDFAQVDGKPGYFAQQLLVYGRAGQPCLRCKSTLLELRQNGRTSVFCQQCQPLRG
jgi:formamidopyrimidine-DNA glycosylase